MGWGAVVLAILQIIIKIWGAINERNIEEKKRRTEAIQSGVRAIVDRDVVRLNSAIQQLR